LSLLLNIEADEYLADFSESYGAVIEVNNGKEKPFPEEKGYFVAPGQVTNIGFTAVSLKPSLLHFPCCFQSYFCRGLQEEMVWCEARQTSKQQTRMPRFMLESLTPC